MSLLAPSRPKLPNGPGPYAWTREEFHRLGDIGWFEGRRAMLIHGALIEEGPMNPPHASGVRRVAKRLESVFGNSYAVSVQLPVNLDADTDPHPDVCVARGNIDTYDTRHPEPQDLVLVIEVADTSLRFDLTTKATLYAEAGIPEYWVLDVVNQQLHVLRDPVNGAYNSVQLLTDTQQVSPLLAHSAQLISVHEFLR
jgi:Uma2 family endonuclease